MCHPTPPKAPRRPVAPPRSPPALSGQFLGPDQLLSNLRQALRPDAPSMPLLVTAIMMSICQAHVETRSPALGRAPCRLKRVDYALRLRLRPRPARPRPSSANEAGSGTSRRTNA